LLAWLLLVAAAANPRWLGEPVGVTASGRDLMLVLDLSQSMEVKDFILKDNAVDRLTALKSVASDFIRRREGDRIGLVLFGEQAYLNVPLTFDRATVERMLGEAVIGIAGRSTAIGDAIGLAAKRLRAQNAEHKTIILMTDGANTSGHVEPRRAAQLAARRVAVVSRPFRGVGRIRRRDGAGLPEGPRRGGGEGGGGPDRRRGDHHAVELHPGGYG
jgi:Ca-activated chloride channel family protein